MILKNLFLRGGKQRLGGAVGYTLGGQQVLRELAAKVKNPRTASQMGQRVKLAGLVNFYKSMRSWAKVGAFSNKPQTWSDYNAFVSANIGTNPVYLTKEQAAVGCAVVAPYIISRGSLPRVETTYDAANQEFQSDIYLGEDFEGGTDYSVGSVSRAIIANNNGIANGDQLSCIAVIQRSSSTGPFVITRAYEMTLDVTSTESVNDDKFNWLTFTTTSDDNTAIAHGTEESNMACAFLLSRKVGGKILTGDAQLCLTPAAESFLSVFRSNVAYTRAIESYGLGESNFLDPGTTGGSSSSVFLGAQILSATFGQLTVPAGGGLGTAPNTIDPIYLALTKAVDPTAIDQVTIRTSNSANDIVLDQSVTIEAGALKIMLEAQQITDIKAVWTSITSIDVAAGDEHMTISFSHNGGQADPGDVTP